MNMAESSWMFLQEAKIDPFHLADVQDVASSSVLRTGVQTLAALGGGDLVLFQAPGREVVRLVREKRSAMRIQGESEDWTKVVLPYIYILYIYTYIIYIYTYVLWILKSYTICQYIILNNIESDWQISFLIHLSPQATVPASAWGPDDSAPEDDDVLSPKTPISPKTPKTPMKSPIALKTLDILSTLKGGQGRIRMDRGGWQLKESADQRWTFWPCQYMLRLKMG